MGLNKHPVARNGWPVVLRRKKKPLPFGGGFAVDFLPFLEAGCARDFLQGGLRDDPIPADLLSAPHVALCDVVEHYVTVETEALSGLGDGEEVTHGLIAFSSAAAAVPWSMQIS